MIDVSFLADIGGPYTGPESAPSRPDGVSPRLWRRFWSKVVEHPSGCWVWTGADRVGYGAFKLDGRTRAAHRLAVEWIDGPIPSPLVVDHLCGNRGCVRPGHLDVTTHRSNILRGALPHFPDELQVAS